MSNHLGNLCIAVLLTSQRLLILYGEKPCSTNYFQLMLMVNFIVIKHMYSHTTTSVKLPNGITNSNKTNLGIRQGDGLSPLLFCLYIDDIANIFDDSCAPCGIGTCKLSHLLYADDLMLLSETKTGLQMCIDKLKEYCDKWKLTVNLKKKQK